MPHTSKAKIASNCREDDRISTLPDELLQHVLGFLLADEAVRTSVLARRWRYLWKSMRCLRIDYRRRREEKSKGVYLCSKFVNSLLRLRDRSSTLDEVAMDFDSYEHLDTWIDIWIRHVLSFQAKVLTVKPRSVLNGSPLVSRHLRRLEFSAVNFDGKFLDFSSCTVLEEVKMEYCFSQTMILSQSIKHMSMNGCVFGDEVVDRIRISVPNLVSLQMILGGSRAPLLESMPSLESAVVSFLNNNCEDVCYEGVGWECCGTCADCCGNDDHNGSCVLLGGLSCATNLELIAYQRMFVFRRDLRWCPTCRRLKTLLLTEWCVQLDLSALVCMLEHSPVLEDLMLQLHEQEPSASKLEVGSSTENPAAISPYLKIIKVEFEEYDDRVCKVFKFLNILAYQLLSKGLLETMNLWFQQSTRG